MDILIIFLIFIIILYLVIEKMYIRKARKNIKCIIHVNGTRGKSTVTRLLHSALYNNNIKVMCKTTGTLPMVINSKNEEIPIKRKRSASIKEQVWIMKQALKEEVDVLIVECMAVDPKLQYISQHNILMADICVMTNVRLDHTYEMGSTLEEIALSLSNTMPENGKFILGSNEFEYVFAKVAKDLNTEIIVPIVKESYSHINFKENIAIGVEVCKHFDILEKDALEGMENYIEDPYALKVYGLNNNSVFINGLSVNDPQSSEIVYNMVIEKYELDKNRLVLIINNRVDRFYRAEHMVMLAQKLKPDEIWIFGAFSNYIAKNTVMYNPRIFKDISEINFEKISNTNIYAVGNIANSGDEIADYMERKFEKYVW